MNRKLIANKMEEMPFKKRRFWYNSVAPSAQTSLRSPKETNSSEHFGEPEQLLRSTSPASQKSYSEVGVIDGSVAITSAPGPSEVKNARNVEIPVAVVPMDETVASLEPDCLVKSESVNRPGLLVKVDSLTQSTNIHSDKNDGALGKSIPQKTDRSHWDLNVMMDEWEKPYAEIVNQQISNSEDDGIQTGKVASDPVSIPSIADPQCMLLETKVPDSERNVLQVSSGLINTEKTCEAFETQDPTMVINMNDLDNNSRLNHNECEFIEQKNNTANIPLQYDKDVSTTPARVLCKLSSKSDTTEKTDSVSFGKPSIGQPTCYVDSMKDEGSEDLKINSGKDPKLTSEDLSSGCRNSNFSGNNMGHVIGVECMSKLQSGYDSPIEDGELREPDAYFWKNNEDCSETGQLDNELVGTDYIDAFENNYNGNQFWDHQDDTKAKGQDGELNDNSSQTGEFGAGKYRKKLSSHEDTPYDGPVQRNNIPFMQPGRKNENNGCEVDFPVTNQESRSYNPHNYRCSKDRDHSKLRRVNSGPPARGSDMSSYGNRKISDNISNDIYRSSTRKRLPADRDDPNDSYRRAPPLRSNKKRNKKKKSGFHPQRGMKAPKENYNERFPDNYSSRRDHKSSTNFNQAAHISKSQSESSLGSPTRVLNEQDQGSSGRVSRHSPRKGNHGDPRRLKSDGNSRFLARHERNSQVVTNRREGSFQNSDLDKNIHHAKFNKYQA